MHDHSIRIGAKQIPRTKLEISNDNMSIEEKLSQVRLIKEKLIQLHDSIDKFIDRHDLKNAVEEYRKLKILCESFPDDLSEEKTALLADAASLFNKIENLRKEFYTTQSAKAKTYTETVVEKRGLDETDAEILQKKISKARNDLVDSHKKIDMLISKQDVIGAMKEYAVLKNLSQSFPKEAAEERVAILSEALAVFDKIKRLKENISKINKEKQAEEEQKQMQKQAFDDLKSEIDNKISTIKSLLDSKNTQQAINEFGNLKQLLAKAPDEDYDSKKTLYNEILSSHLDMKILDQDHKNKLSMQSDEATKINEIRREISVLNSILSKKEIDFEEATNFVLEIKHKTMVLSNDFFEEKYEFMKAVDECESKIISAKTINKISDQQNKLKGAIQ